MLQQPSNSPFSHNWYFSIHSVDQSADIEMVRAESGVNYFNNESSRLCKFELLNRYKKLISSHPSIPSLIPYDDDGASINALDGRHEQATDEGTREMMKNLKQSYIVLKNRSQPYKKAKIALYSTLKECGLGSWVSTPIDVDLFETN